VLGVILLCLLKVELLTTLTRKDEPVQIESLGCAAQPLHFIEYLLASTGISRNMLRYKAIARGATFVDVSEHLSTQICSDCGVVGGPKGIAGLEIRGWECDACGSVHDRDVNAARNILRLGCQTLAEGSSTLSAKR
jgi:hypothetical protein